VAVADFVFATCAPGLEPALKLELARTRPELRFAYSRPGLVTFKAPGPVAADDPPSSAFARVWGRSIGSVADPAVAAARLAELAPARVHAFPRDPVAAVDLAPWQALGPGGPAAPGELVADVIVARDEPAWLGVHRHDGARPAHPGGAIPVDIPADAPSRAYAKIEEAIGWAGLDVRAGEVALEIGSAPGGAALALARRGVTLWGADPGVMQVTHPLIHHLDRTISALRWEELPPRVDWLLMDVNLAPQVALHELARLAPPLREHLRGAVLTLKLNDQRVVEELPALIARAGELGLGAARATHLPSNRREICCVLQT
jgi:23S rRNA (cytidine2498-2'-O)-methyltransferase